MKEAKERGRNAPLGKGGGGESVGRVLGESLLVEGSLEVLKSESDYCGERVSSLRRRRAKTRGSALTVQDGGVDVGLAARGGGAVVVALGKRSGEGKGGRGQGSEDGSAHVEGA